MLYNPFNPISFTFLLVIVIRLIKFVVLAMFSHPHMYEKENSNGIKITPLRKQNVSIQITYGRNSSNPKNKYNFPIYHFHRISQFIHSSICKYCIIYSNFVFRICVSSCRDDPYVICSSIANTAVLNV